MAAANYHKFNFVNQRKEYVKISNTEKIQPNC